MNLPRLIVAAGMSCLVIGVVVALGTSFAVARTEDEWFGRSVGRAIKDTVRLVLDLVP
jgi:hypothetical protein